MAKHFVNSGDPDQKPHSAESDLGLHFLPITLLWVSPLNNLIKVCFPHKSSTNKDNSLD